MLDFLFKTPGKTLEMIGKVLFFIIVISGVFAFIGSIVSGGIRGIFIGIMILIASIIYGIVGSVMLIGMGQLFDDVKTIKNKLNGDIIEK